MDVLLEAGRDGRCFTYLDREKLGVDLGDLVLVRLKGRAMHGLVVARRSHVGAEGLNKAEKSKK